MERNKHKKIVFLTLFFYLIISFVIFWYYRFCYSFDTVIYLGAAKLVAAGRVSESITCYWPPLLSWIMSLVFLFNLPPLLMLKILQFVFGAFLLYGICLIISKFVSKTVIIILTLFTTSILIVHFSAWCDMSDILFFSLLIYYLLSITSDRFLEGYRLGIYCGLLGGLCILAKHYTIFFFPLHFVFSNFLYYRKTKDSALRKLVIRNFIISFLLFIIITGAWIIVLSLHYRKFTFFETGTSTIYTALSSGGEKKLTFDFPNHLLFELTNDLKNGYLNIPGYSIKAHVDLLKDLDLKFFNYIFLLLRFFLKNIYHLFANLLLLSVFSVTILIGSILVFLDWLDKEKKLIFPIVVAAVLVYYSGFIIYPPNQRYLLFAHLLLLLLGSSILEKFFLNSTFFTKLGKQLLIFSYFFSFVALPIKDLVLFHSEGRQIYQISQTLKNRFGIIEGKICCHSDYPTYIISLYLDSEFYPVIINEPFKREVDTALLEKQLKKYDIDYYFTWEERETTYPFLENYQEILKGEIKGLKIYCLKDKTTP